MATHRISSRIDIGRDAGLDASKESEGVHIDVEGLHEHRRSSSPLLSMNKRRKAGRKLIAVATCLFVVLGLLMLVSDSFAGVEKYKKLPWNAKRKGLILSTLKKGDLTWLKSIPEEYVLPCTFSQAQTKMNSQLGSLQLRRR